MKLRLLTGGPGGPADPRGPGAEGAWKYEAILFQLGIKLVNLIKYTYSNIIEHRKCISIDLLVQ